MTRMYDLIQKKKQGKALTLGEINFMIDSFTKGEIPVEQMSAFLMAVYFQKMNSAETTALTMAMANSGDTVDLSSVNGIKVDKHSTGGVGDKTTFIITPIVASLGVKVAKMSGRGLGHTGGTVDKIESIPGIKIEFQSEEFLKIIKETGACLAGQSGDLAPADKKIYALRDVTATVDNLSLIAASVMSKKIASGTDGIVLDVKTGSGAFMKSIDESIELAQLMVEIGESCGRKMSALITDMNIPTGYAIGNSLEMIEAIEVLKGAGPADLREICIELAANMIHLATGQSVGDCRQQVWEQIENGAAFEKFVDIIAAQNGNTDYLHDTNLFEKANITYNVIAPVTGYISHMNAEDCGIASCLLGAGRLKINDEIDHSAGIILKAKTGDFVNKGDTFATFHTNNETSITSAEEIFLRGFKFTTEAPTIPPLIYARITKNTVEKN